MNFAKATMKCVGRKVLYILFFAFVLASWILISPVNQKARSYYRSSQLQKTITKDGDTERTEYADSEGRIMIAADAGYATMIKTKTEKGILEQYYDENGEPISRFFQYYAVIREFDERGNNIRNTYLDQDGNPCMIRDDYATEAIEYNENNLVSKILFYDTERHPVCTSSYGHGLINEYDDSGNNIRTSYFDLSGKPMMTKLGYAAITRVFYSGNGPDKGRVEREFYYDDQGEPVALSLGQYGIYKEYNELGQGIVIVYLDADGEPIITNKGYTKVVRTFAADNNVATEQYYDMDGNPISLSEGQYGVRKEKGQTVYLNRNGESSFNLRNLLNYHPRLVILIAGGIIILSELINKKWAIVLFMLYVCVIIYFTLMFRDNNTEGMTEPLSYYRKLFTSSTARSDIIKNIWLFIPLGAILYQIYPKMLVIFFPIIVSVIIESIQYTAGIGFCELDDIISNSIGGGLGFLAGKLSEDCILLLKKRRQKKSNKEGLIL